LLSLETLVADPAMTRSLFGPAGTQIVALLAMVNRDCPHNQYELAGQRWNQAGHDRRQTHYLATQAIWAGANGIRRHWLLNVDRYAVGRPYAGPWRDTTAQILLADACGGEVARGWIGDDATQVLVRDWFYVWLGAA
jgi:hypothetical protein